MSKSQGPTAKTTADGDSNASAEKGTNNTAKTTPSSNKVSKSQTKVRDENRDDWENGSRKEGAVDERDSSSQNNSDRAEPTSSKRSQTKPSPSRKNKGASGASPHPSPHPSPPQRPFMPEGYPSYHQPPPGRGPYGGPHGMHGGPGPGPGGPGPRGPPPSSAPFPPPPPHYYGGGPPDHYRGPPPPPHYHHQMPPMPHPGQPGHYGGPGGHYCPPPNMAGRPGPPPPSYPPYGAPYPPGPPPPMGYHGGPPPNFHHQGNPPSHMPSLASDSNSISSSKSRGSDRRSTKSSSSSGTRKKRTIDGIHHQKEKNLPSAYSFRRSNSTASTSSTVTAGNNTGIEAHQMSNDSPRKRDQAPSRASSHLPPLPQQSSNIFDEERYHRRNYSGASTASSLSVGGFSLSSYDGPRGETNISLFSWFQIVGAHVVFLLCHSS